MCMPPVPLLSRRAVARHGGVIPTVGVVMKKFFRIVADHPKFVLVVLAAAATLGVFAWRSLAVDVFPDISVPRVTIQTEAGGLTAEEVELLTVPSDLAGYKTAITEALYKGMKRNVESEADPKNAEVG